MTPRVLVLRALGLGDFLTGVPAYRALRRAFPHHRVVLAAPAVLGELAALTGAVDEVLDTTGLAPLAWPGGPPDVAVNLHGRGPQSHGVLDQLSPVRRIGFRPGDGPAGWDGPGWTADEHEVDRWCRLLVHHGIAAEPTDLRLPRPVVPSPSTGAVVVHPGAAYGSRRWPPERFAAVARWLLRSGREVVVTGGSAERDLAAHVGAQAGLGAGTVLAGDTTLTELAALIARASLLICGDTGVAHLATAFGTPSVLLFGPTPPAWWGPRTSGPHRVLWHGERVRGDPWSDDIGPALDAITVEEVILAAFASLVADRAPVTPA